MPTHTSTPVAHQRHSPWTLSEEPHNDLLHRLEHLNLTTTEVRLVRLLVRSTPQPVRDTDLATAITGCPNLDHRRRAVLEQQITRLRSKLMANGLRILCVERYGYLLQPDHEA